MEEIIKQTEALREAVIAAKANRITATDYQVAALYRKYELELNDMLKHMKNMLMLVS